MTSRVKGTIRVTDQGVYQNRIARVIGWATEFFLPEGCWTKTRRAAVLVPG